jgi:transposase
MSASPTGSTQRSEIPFDQFDHFAGFDWASDKHDACIVDRSGRIVVQLEFPDTAEGWKQFGGKLPALGKVAVAIETSRGAAVERLLSLGLTVYPMNPKAAERYRDRKAPSGVKDDTLDAWSFGDALRTDGRDWRPLLPEDPQSQLLRILCRDEIALIEQRTALVLQLKAALHEYFPAALEAFDDWAQRFAWEFVAQFPTPKALVTAGKRRWQSFLHTHRLCRPATMEKRLEVFARADQFASPSSSVTTAKSLLAVTLAKTLRALQGQIDEYRKQIEQAFSDHPDGGIFASLPAGGERLAPRILGEMGSDRRLFESAESLQCYAGTAPVTKKSGKSRYVGFRRACNMTLRTTIHLWSDESRRKCAWADAYYQQKKAQGMSHAKSLRCLGQRWLKIIWRMWQDHVPYDEALHMKSLSQSGSWVLGLLPKPAPAASK